MSCEELDLNDAVLLQECPPIYTMVLVILAATVGLSGYLGREMQSKRKGEAPKLQSTYFKVRAFASVTAHDPCMHACERTYVCTYINQYIHTICYKTV